MKIEIGENLLMSWLKHVKECKITATNWKASPIWEVKHRDALEALMRLTQQHFMEKYGYDVFKGTLRLEQLLSQAEIDVLGIDFSREPMRVYAVDVAFHEYGLRYGSRTETISSVVKKLIRAAMCVYGFFNRPDGAVIFASPKIIPSVYESLLSCSGDVSSILKSCGLDFEVRVIANGDFSGKILRPVLNMLGDIADTSELFVRSLQMYRLFADAGAETPAAKSGDPSPDRPLPPVSPDGKIDELSPGAVVRSALSKILERGGVSENELALLQTKEYSGRVFGLPCPLLKKADAPGKVPESYYPSPVKINGVEYYVCSRWSGAPEEHAYLSGWVDSHPYGKNPKE